MAKPEFEFDPAKSAANLLKHGIDFVDAQALWDDNAAIRGVGTDGAEERDLLIGMIDSKHWAAVHTYRGPRIRIISVRRARVKEAETYDRQKDHG